MGGTQAVAAKELHQFAYRFLIFLQAGFLSLLFFGMFRDFAPGRIVKHIRISLNFLDVVVGVERGLDHLEGHGESAGLQRKAAVCSESGA